MNAISMTHFLPILALIIGLSSNIYANTNYDMNTTSRYELELVPESDQSPSDLQIAYVESEEELSAWAQELNSLEEPSADASEFEIEIYYYILSLMPEYDLYLAGPKAKKRSCAALGSDQTATGNASWYGGRFHGRRTANGEIFNKNDLTAAHKTLPFNSIIEVTYRGKTVRVRINDAGPYHGNRIIDLSEAAARELGLIGPGTGRVQITIISCGNQ